MLSACGCGLSKNLCAASAAPMPSHNVSQSSRRHHTHARYCSGQPSWQCMREERWRCKLLQASVRDVANAQRYAQHEGRERTIQIAFEQPGIIIAQRPDGIAHICIVIIMLLMLVLLLGRLWPATDRHLQGRAPPLQGKKVWFSFPQQLPAGSVWCARGRCGSILASPDALEGLHAQVAK